MRKEFFILLIFASVSSVSALDFFNVSDVNFLIRLNGSVTLSAGTSFDVKNFSLVLHSLPQEGTFSLSSDVVGDIGVMGDDTVYYINRSSLERSFDYTLVLNFSRTVQPVILSSLELLTDTSYDDSISKFTVSDELTTPSDDIKKKASELIAGKKYRIDAILAIMDFVHNYITYDLSVGDELKDALWVWDNKIGTCDEYSVLAATMLRSVKIPVRFVHGYVYSDTTDDFGPHSWLEVYLDSKWVAFDPTYAQYGFVDASHIAFSKTYSGAFEQSQVEYLQRDATVQVSVVDVNVDVLSMSEKQSLFELSASLDRSIYYEDDYALLTVGASSKLSSGLLIVPISFVTTKELEKILLPPAIKITGRSGTEYAVFKTPKVNNSNTYLSHPLIVKIPFSNNISLSLQNNPGSPKTSLFDVNSKIPSVEVPETYSATTSVYFEPTVFSLTPSAVVNVRNMGNQELSGLELRVSSQDYSKMLDTLFVNGDMNVTIPLIFSSYGLKNIIVDLYYGKDKIATYTFQLNIVNRPNITLNAELGFVNGEYVVITWFNDTNNASLSSSVLSVDTGLLRESYDIGSGIRTSSFKDINILDNITLSLVVLDSSKQAYTFEKVIPIERTLLERVILFIRRLFYRVRSS